MDILNALSAIATIASLILQAGVPQGPDGRPNYRAAIDAIRGRLEGRLRNALDIKGAEDLVVILVIDPGLLDDLRREVEKCIARYRGDLAGGRSRGHRDVADKRAERCVCENLNRIRRRNNGQLPGDMDNWWQSYHCIDDYDY